MRRTPIRGVASLVAIGAALWLGGVATAAAGPAAHWRLNEPSGSVADDAVGSLNGAIHGAASVATGHDGPAFRFDGADDVTVPSSSLLRSADTTVSLWVRASPGATPSAGQVILDNGDILCGGTGYALVATATHAKLVFRDAEVITGIGTLQMAGSVALPSLWDGAWHHVAFSSHGAADGFVYLYFDGWHVATTPSGPVDVTNGIAYGSNPTAAFVIGDDDGGCGPGFVGDIDDVRVFNRLVERSELAALEPEIETSLEIDQIAPAVVGSWIDVDVTLLPAPAMPGRFIVYVTGDDGIERPGQGFDVGLGNLSEDGHYEVKFGTDYGGESSIRVAWQPEAPALPSEATASVTIEKSVSETDVEFPNDEAIGDKVTVGEPLRVVARVGTPSHAPVVGNVELWDVTGTPFLVGTRGIEPTFAGAGGTEFSVPARPAGEYVFEARYLGSASNKPSVSPPGTLTVLPAPVLTSVKNTFVAGSKVSGSSVPTKLTWTVASATSGLDRFQLEQSVDGGAMTTISSSLTVATTTRTLASGHTYRFRVRGIDPAGIPGPWAIGPSLKVNVAQEGSSRISYAGTWRTAESSSYWGGKARYASAAGATAKITFTGRSFAWLAAVGPARGSARVYVNGTLVATVSLQRPSGASKTVVFATTWTTSASRTVTIKVNGTAGHPRVDVDALVWGT